MAKYLDKEGLETYEATVKGRLQNKQDTLESGTNIKTINNESLLGSGNITIQGGGGTPTDVKINGTSITSNNEADIKTEGTYNASTNKIATMSDIPTIPTLATVATTGDYDDLLDKPTIPTVGNAKTYYGTSSTSASTAAKTVTCSGFTLETGATIFVKFTNANSYDGTATLNVNSTGAKDIATVGTTKTSRYYWKSGEIVGFIYDGTNYVMIEQGNATTTYYGVTKLSSSTTSTSEAVAATPKAVKTAYDLANGKQNALVSGTNIKTINSTSLLGSGDISVVATETDPVFSASAAAGITSSDITSWNNKSTFSGNYNDLTNKPTIPDSTSDLNNDSGFIDNTVSNLTNYTTTTALQSLLNGKMDYTELTGNSIRIWSLEEGFYINSSYATVYYYGSSDTTNKFTIDVGSIIMISDATNRSSNHKTFLVVTSMGSSCYMGYSTSTAGELYDLLKSSDIKNNLTTSTAGKVLDASQGKALKDTLDATTSTSISNMNNIGTLANLTTTTKTDLVSAINEVKGDIPTVPTNVSSFNNDAGYLTSVPVNDVKVNNTSILSSGDANLVTNTAYDSTTNKLATMADIPAVVSPNIMTVYLAADYTIANTNTAYDMLNTAVSSSVGSKLTFSGGKIVIGAGVSKVKVSYTAKSVSAANQTRTFTYLMQDINGVATAMSQEGHWYSAQNQQVNIGYQPRVVSVSQGDAFYLRCYGYKNNYVAGAAGTFMPTFLTVEVIE